MSTSHPKTDDSQSPTIHVPAPSPSPSDVTQVASSDAKTPIVKPSPPPLRTLRHYVLLRELGRGGMGIVYEAEDQVLHRHVALKVLPPAIAGNEEMLARFRRESEAAARLDHPGIVKVFGIGEDQGTPFYVMEFVEGLSLDRVLDGGPIPFTDAARVARVVADALGYAHRRGVIHRDIKPANLMIVGARGHDLPADLRVVVTDFGLARGAESSSLTKTGDVLGTPAYMPPEQAAGSKQVDSRADLYSLGATLYEAATGKKPFGGEATGEVLQRILSDDPLPPHAIDARIPRDLETIILKLMEKDPARRYATAEEVADDLARFLSEEPIRARRVSMVGRLLRKARKNKAAAALVAIAIGAVVIGPGVWLGLRWRRALATERKIEAAERALLAGNARGAFDLVNEALADDPDNPRARLVRAEADRARHDAEETGRAEARLGSGGPFRERGDALWKEAAAARQAALDLPLSEEAKTKAGLAQAARTEKAARAEYAKALGAFHEALGIAPGLSAAADRAATIYLAYHMRAEEAGAGDAAAEVEVFLRGLVDRCSAAMRARLVKYLGGVGHVTIETDPPASITLYRYEEQDGELVAVTHGEWPGGEVALEMGSWVAVATAEGRVETRIPFEMPREGDVNLRVNLRTPAEVPDGFVVVTGGPFWMGGDERAFGAGPRRRVDVPDFAMGVFEVTAEEYIAFLNDLGSTQGWPVAWGRMPRTPAGQAQWDLDQQGVKVPPGWDTRCPVEGISREDAEAYCDWLSDRDRATYSLPTGVEWEKAARGVDGRLFPWGNEIADDRCICRPHPVHLTGVTLPPVGTATDDESPYGVRDMAGGVAEWSADSPGEDPHIAVRRGSAWGYELETARVATRIGTGSRGASPYVGFRVVRELAK